jgi:hypothetical protein
MKSHRAIPSLVLSLAISFSFPAVLGNHGKMSYIFDRDAAGNDKCTAARDKQDDPETFRLYCVNKVESFKFCSVTCSEALTFEGSRGKCNDYECNFYDYVFQDQDNQPLVMNTLARNKVILFAVVPLWESQAQYFYQLLEEIRNDYKQSTEAFLLPMDVDPTDEVPIHLFHTKRVNILNSTSPVTIGYHPFLGFLQTLRYTSGFRDFNVFTDRPVLFMIDTDGRVVERLVIPTYAKIQETLKTFGAAKSADHDDEL